MLDGVQGDSGSRIIFQLSIAVIGGWDGRKALNSVEFYNDGKREWEESRRTRLSQERRWAAATQISHKLFSYCVQKRS